MERKHYSELTVKERAIRTLYRGPRHFVADRRGWYYHKGQRGTWKGGTGLKIEEVAELFDVTEQEITELKEMDCSWDIELMVNNFFKFYERNGRWPLNKELGPKNYLPSERGIRNITRRSPGYTYIQELMATDKRLTVEMALTMPNLTVRRAAIERIGFDKIKKRKDCTKISQDEFGILWHIMDMRFVEVINSTPEPDGSFSHYYLRVPPECETPQQAVAWTFGVPTDAEWQNFKIGVAT